MRFSKFYYPVLMAAMLFHSCSKDGTVLTEDGQQEEDGPVQPIDLTARTAAQTLYDDYYLASNTESSDSPWSGNESSCDAGTVPQHTMDKIFMRIAYFRKAVGLHNTLAENETKSDKAQQAALMMKSNGTLDHFPPESWTCYTEAGSDGARNSLLTQSRNAEAVDSYMRDAGASNGPVGHRRWLLWPRLQEIGVGNTNNTNAIWVIGNAGSAPGDAPEFISWPPEGYSPKNLAYPRWSFSIRDADFTGTTITMKDGNNQNVAFSVEELDNQFGDRTIVWVPAININTLGDEATFTVELQNVVVGGETKDFAYEVVLFDSAN